MAWCHGGASLPSVWSLVTAAHIRTLRASYISYFRRELSQSQTQTHNVIISGSVWCKHVNNPLKFRSTILAFVLKCIILCSFQNPACICLCVLGTGDAAALLTSLCNSVLVMIQRTNTHLTNKMSTQYITQLTHIFGNYTFSFVQLKVQFYLS